MKASARPATRARLGLALAVLAASLGAHAQSAVRDIPWRSTPYVPAYSAPCRTVPPPEATALAVHRALWPRAGFAEFDRQLRALQARPVETLSAAEAEAYFVLLGAIDFEALVDRRPMEQMVAALQDGRQHGLAIAQRFGDDSHVRCAYLTAERKLMEGLALRSQFSDEARAQARDDQRAFLERALRGEVLLDAGRAVLLSNTGQAYLDQGFRELPDGTARAAASFETGAMRLLEAASLSDDSRRHETGWQRYAFMLAKLPIGQQLDIATRLVAHAEQGWLAASGRRDAALEAYLHLLSVAGQIGLNAKRGDAATAMFARYLATMQELRRRDPRDANHQVNEALAYALAGDAHALNGEHRSAKRAYESAQRAYESSDEAAQEMLRFQEFPQELQARRRALR